MKRKKYLLMILDGWGISMDKSNNAIYAANTFFLNKLKNEYLYSELSCSGSSVGLPNGVMGNSEVGHLMIGSGRKINQDLVRINKSIEDGSFFKNQILITSFKKTLENNSSLHLMGLLSDGGVHSHISHLYALLKLAKKIGIKDVYIHVILDGRDTSPNKGIEYIEELTKYIIDLGCGTISTICGRYYCMDRDNRWDRIERAYKLYSEGIGYEAFDAIEAVKSEYLKGYSDEFVKPIILCIGPNKIKKFLRNKDVLIFFNFRADRAREISSVFTENGFKKFKRKVYPRLSRYVSMTIYDEKFIFPHVFKPLKISNVLGKIVSDAGLRQIRIAETEKYAHVTFFLNGGIEEPFLNEDRLLVPSIKDVATYDQRPEMSALLITDSVLNSIDSNYYELIIVNFANMDMVGHTGVFNSAVIACEVVDRCIKKIINRLLDNEGIALITADHGNSEKIFDCDGISYTAHTNNKVPIMLIGKNFNNNSLNYGSLRDVAPTLIDLMGIKQPKEMDGRSLICNNY